MKTKKATPDHDYQLARHLSAWMRQWPGSDRQAARQYIAGLLRAGQAWKYPAPQQLELNLEG